MKKTNLTYLAAILAVTLSCSIQLANAQTVLTDNFSTPANWGIANSIIGTGTGPLFNNIAVNAGTLNFTNVHCQIDGATPDGAPTPCDRAPAERRARRAIGATINTDDAFRLEVDYTFLDPIQTAPLGAIPIALTAGGQDIIGAANVNNPNMVTPTTQDAVGFWLATGISNITTNQCGDQRAGNVTISPFYKDNGSTPVVVTFPVNFNPTAGRTYRLRLERHNATFFSFEVFDMASPFNVIFSNSFCLPAGIVLTGFNTVQAANLIRGDISRISNSRLDNLFIQRLPNNPNISQVIFTEDFNSGLASWTRANVNTNNNIPYHGGQSNVYNNIGLNNNELHLRDVHCGYAPGASTGNGQCDIATGERRIYRQIAPVISAVWRLEFDFSWLNAMYAAPNNPAWSTTPTGSIPMCLSAGTNDVIANASGFTSQDAIGVKFLSDIVVNPNDPCASLPVEQPYFSIFYKDQNNASVTSNGRIYFNQQQCDYYYISLERTSATDLRLSVFTDVARTQHLIGSPITMNIPAGIDISGLNTLQATNLYNGNIGRAVCNRIDNIRIIGQGGCNTNFNASFDLAATCNPPLLSFNITANPDASANNPAGTNSFWTLFTALNATSGQVGDNNLGTQVGAMQTTVNAAFNNLADNSYILVHRVGIAPSFIESRAFFTTTLIGGNCIQKMDNSELPIVGDKVKLFPNPTKTDITINYIDDENSKAALSIYDITGKLVLTQTIQANTDNNISIANLAVGMYVANIRGAKLNKSLNFIKE